MQVAGSTDSGTYADIGTKTLPLLPGQRTVWFSQLLTPELSMCFAQYIDIQGEVEFDLLRKSIARVSFEFQSPYIRIIEVDGKPAQTFDHNIDDDVEVVDLRSSGDPMGSAEAWMTRDYTRLVNILRDRLIVLSIIRIGDSRHLLYYKIHSIALDIYGAGTMVNRIAEVYTALLNGKKPKPSRVARAKTIYDIVHEYRGSSRFDADREYWRDRLAGVGEGATLAAKPGAPESINRTKTAEVSSEVAGALWNADSTFDVTPVAVIIAAFGSYLSKVAGRDEVIVNIPVTSRTTAVLRRSGGVVENILPLLIRVRSDSSIGELFSQVQHAIMGALRHQRFPIEDIRRDLAVSGLPNTLAGPIVSVALFDHSVSMGSVPGRIKTATFGPIDDLLVEVSIAGQDSRISINFRGNPNRYSEEELSTHHKNFMRLVSALSLTSPEKLVGAAVGEIFFEQKDAGLDAGAIVILDEALTEAERNLNRLQSLLAAHTGALGAVVTSAASGTTGSVNLESRSKTADDPLSDNRIRYLSDAFSGRTLAAFAGVSTSQLARWAMGKERPGPLIAPLLIDLEHVLAKARLVWGEEAAQRWFISSNAHLGGARPLDALRVEGSATVLNALDGETWGGAA
ncbi:MAG: condensation domain-containing protein [Rhodococcus sp. (in: high G+C Gram-positive bacteria)]